MLKSFLEQLQIALEEVEALATYLAALHEDAA